MSFKTPVALFVFNRPEPTRRVFAEVAKVRPRTLLIIADGPRESRHGEAALCAEVREIVEAVDWECTVLRNYAPRNLGCRERVSSGLDWVFSVCEDAIILEDDCLPHPSFFGFCAELLARYRDDERILMISGDNFQLEQNRSAFSYYFSGYAHIWGWATWRRAWRHYDVEMKLWPRVRDRLFRDLGDGISEEYWRSIFDRTFSGDIKTWDYQWMFACFAQGGMAVLPEVNLVSNIGFGVDATHTGTVNHLACLPISAVDLPLRHPPYVMRDVEADRIAFDRVFLPRPRGRAGWRSRISSLVGRLRTLRSPGSTVPDPDR